MAQELPLYFLPLGPKAVASLTKAAPASVYDSRPQEDRFSFREDIAHLTDLEALFLARFKAILANPGGPLGVIDIDENAKSYGGLDPKQQAELFKTRRDETIQFLQTIAPADYDKFGVHPEYGNISVMSLAELLVRHDLYHVEHLASILAS